MRELVSGPVGNPASQDPFERAQAQAPIGWHVEGQIIAGLMRASGPNAEGLNVWVRSWSGPDALAKKMRLAAMSY